MDFAGVATAISSVVSLFDGELTIGGITLSGFEVPEKLNWGGAQRTVVHKMPGGARTIDAMGADDADIKWSGYFSGYGASARARSIDSLRTAGVAVPLSWPGFSRNVIVTDFHVSSERNGFLLPYTITCAVIPAAPGPASPSLLQSIGNDIGNAIGIPNLMEQATSVLQTVQPALQAVQKLMPVVGVLTKGSPAFVGLTQAVTFASGAVSAGLSVTQASMSGLQSGAAATGTPLGTSNPATAVSSLSQALVGTQALAGLSSIGGFLGRIGSNLTHAGS